MMRKILPVFLLLVAFLPYWCFAAADTAASSVSRVDSLLAAFAEKPMVSVANRFYQEVERAGLADTPLQLSETDCPSGLVSDSLQAYVWYWAAEWYYAEQDFEQTVAYGRRSLDGLTLPSQRADCANLIAIAYVRLGKHNEAIEYAKITGEIDKAGGNADNISSSLNTLASIYVTARRPEEAEQYILEAIGYAEKSGNEMRLATILGSASEIEHSLGKNEEALRYAWRALEIEQRIGTPTRAAVRRSQAAMALVDLGRYEEAYKELDAAIPVFRETGNRHSLGIVCNQMGELLHLTGNNAQAAVYFEEAAAIFFDLHELTNEATAHKGLQQVLRNSDPAAAIQHAERYNAIQDSLYRQETAATLSKYATEYGTRELQAQNNNIRKMMHRINWIIIILSVLVAMIIIFVIFFRHRELKKAATARETINELKEVLHSSQSQENKQERIESETEADSNEVFLQKVDALLLRQVPMEPSVERIAAAMYMTTQTFRRRMMTAAGMTPKAYITKIQMKQARRLMLTEPDKTISEIAYACGVEDSSNFTRAFRREFGETPTQYRAKLK